MGKAAITVIGGASLIRHSAFSRISEIACRVKSNPTEKGSLDAVRLAPTSSRHTKKLCMRESRPPRLEYGMACRVYPVPSSRIRAECWLRFTSRVRDRWCVGPSTVVVELNGQLREGESQ